MRRGPCLMRRAFSRWTPLIGGIRWNWIVIGLRTESILSCRTGADATAPEDEAISAAVHAVILLIIKSTRAVQRACAVCERA